MFWPNLQAQTAFTTITTTVAQLLATRFALDKSLIKGNYSPLCFEDLCIEFSAESLYGMYSSFFPYSSPPFAKDFSLRDGLLEVV